MFDLHEITNSQDYEKQNDKDDGNGADNRQHTNDLHFFYSQQRTAQNDTKGLHHFCRKHIWQLLAVVLVSVAD